MVYYLMSRKKSRSKTLLGTFGYSAGFLGSGYYRNSSAKEARDEMISVTDTKTKRTLGTIDADSLTYDISTDGRDVR